MIDAALLRPGRLDRLFYVPLPDEQTRLKVFQVHTRKKPLHAEVDLNLLVSQTDGYSGAEIQAVCKEAALAAITEDIEANEITQEHFRLALQNVKPRINAELTAIYDTFRKRENHR